MASEPLLLDRNEARGWPGSARRRLFFAAAALAHAGIEARSRGIVDRICSKPRVLPGFVLPSLAESTP